MRITASRIAAAVTLATLTLLTPIATTEAGALPPCCSEDLVVNYYATADMTGPIVGQYDDGDCQQLDWGQNTPYIKYTHVYCTGPHS